MCYQAINCYLMFCNKINILNIHLLPHSEHSFSSSLEQKVNVSVLGNNCCFFFENNLEHINTPRADCRVLITVPAGGVCNNHCALKG